MGSVMIASIHPFEMLGYRGRDTGRDIGPYRGPDMSRPHVPL